MPFLLKRILFRLHWICGLTAGLVLAVVGFTGAMLSFEDELLRLLNPQLQVRAEGRTPLAPDTLIAVAQAAHPDFTARSFAWNSEGAVEVRLAFGQERGGLVVMVDPYTGAVLGSPRGMGFFRVNEQLHRNLASGPVGKRIVGLSTAILLWLAVSGLVLRWPRRATSPSAWLMLDTKLRGRSLIWHLHAIIATWVLVPYFLATLTGLWWSFEVYRNAINGLAGVVSPPRPPGSEAPPIERGRPGGAMPNKAVLVSIDIAFATFRTAAPDAARATVVLPRLASMPVEIRYQTADSPHGRAWNILRIGADGVIRSGEQYAGLSPGRRFILSIFPLHSGGFFGWPGRLVMGFASILMPLFAITGIWLWLQRRRQAARVKAIRVSAKLSKDNLVFVQPACQDSTVKHQI